MSGSEWIICLWHLRGAGLYMCMNINQTQSHDATFLPSRSQGGTVLFSLAWMMWSSSSWSVGSLHYAHFWVIQWWGCLNSKVTAGIQSSSYCSWKPHVSPQNAIGQIRIHHTQRNVCVWGGWTGDSRWKINQDQICIPVGRATASCGCSIASKDMHAGTGLT